MAKQSSYQRIDGRGLTSLRPVGFHPGYTAYPEGSVLIQQGETHVLCNVSVEARVPTWMSAQGLEGGWITAEYAMLPRATHERSARAFLRPKSRNQEIQRLVGRALRAAVRLNALPPITCIVDCDVLQADGGTRTAAISGGYLALIIALHQVLPDDSALDAVLKAQVAAVSVGWLDDQILLDLNYAEDSSADADLNVVMNSDADFIEVQGTAERSSIPRSVLDSMLDTAQGGLKDLLQLQLDCLRSQGIHV